MGHGFVSVCARVVGINWTKTEMKIVRKVSGKTFKLQQTVLFTFFARAEIVFAICSVFQFVCWPLWDQIASRSFKAFAKTGATSASFRKFSDHFLSSHVNKNWILTDLLAN